MNDKLSLAEGPYYGEFGGRFVPESLIHALDELESAYKAAKRDPAFPEMCIRDSPGGTRAFAHDLLRPSFDHH